jgi:cytochrome c-type biogenesis protein CcmF
MWQSLPQFGTLVVFAILVVAAYTFAVAVVAGRGRPRYLQAARLGAYGTVALVGLGIVCLAYAFITHDFRIRYVAHYSNRAMTPAYLLTALWGGQDGSILWWLFLLSLYTGACVRWMRGRFVDLQPYVIATLMVVVAFFASLMIFAANPFATSVAGAQIDGEGLNPLLRNFYMIIHPPSLYTGFVGCTVPFAFAVAALVTGRLDNEWIVATRKWMLFAWLFLSLGNALGMLWAYEELGWGGYWAWDPVENAACLPWFTASAYVHSVMIQERRGMLKVWNVVLICITFFLTIFGTFLTRSGLIASVHSFAQSNIGIYFVWCMGFIVAACAGLVAWRLPQLKSEGRIEAILSREAAFVVNNYALLGIAVFIAVATVFPRISEWLMHQASTVGPTFYNAWLPPVGLVVFALMGIAPLFGWRKTSNALFWRGFRIPVAVASVVGLLHLAFGAKLRMPPFFTPERIYEGTIGVVLQKIDSGLPLVASVLVAFNLSIVVQEYARGIAARRRSSSESVFAAFGNLVAKSRRRYGGYIVHAGIALMFVGFTGRAWGIDKEASLKPGETFVVDHYELKYAGPRMEVDQEKRMVFADLEVRDASSGRAVGRASPAKFIYRERAEQPTTEVSMLHSVRDDLYLIVGTVNPETKVATFQAHVNPLVSWIWLGVGILILGAVVAMWPEATLEESGAWGYLRAAGAVTTSVVLGLMLALTPAKAFGQTTSSEHAGTVQIDNPREKALFSKLLCQCGDCARLPLSSCTCSTADAARDEIRSRLASGESEASIVADYVKEYGSGALAVPPNEGGLRAIYLVPLGAGILGAGLVVSVLRRWKQRGAELAPAGGPAAALDERDEYDDKLDEELDD